MGHELELSTGFTVGFCYHKAADLRVCQAAHSLSCVRSCSALLQSVGTVHLEILNKLLTVPSRVWSLTKEGQGEREREKGPKYEQSNSQVDGVGCEG